MARLATNQNTHRVLNSLMGLRLELIGGRLAGRRR